jgi:hypothetical protein
MVEIRGWWWLRGGRRKRELETVKGSKEESRNRVRKGK